MQRDSELNNASVPRSPVKAAHKPYNRDVPAFDGLAPLWVVIAIVSAIVEVLIPHFGLIFVAIGALVAAVVAAFHAGAVVQVAVFTIALVASFTLLRAKLLSKFHSRGVPSRTDTLMGREAVVTHDIDPTLGTGRVTVGGQDWAAHSATAIAAGTQVRVVSADGIVLEVTRT